MSEHIRTASTHPRPAPSEKRPIQAGENCLGWRRCFTNAHNAAASCGEKPAASDITFTFLKMRSLAFKPSLSPQRRILSGSSRQFAPKPSGYTMRRHGLRRNGWFHKDSDAHTAWSFPGTCSSLSAVRMLGPFSNVPHVPGRSGWRNSARERTTLYAENRAAKVIDHTQRHRLRPHSGHSDRSHFRDLLAELAERYAVRLHAFVLMDYDHLYPTFTPPLFRYFHLFVMLCPRCYLL